MLTKGTISKIYELEDNGFSSGEKAPLFVNLPYYKFQRINQLFEIWCEFKPEIKEGLIIELDKRKFRISRIDELENGLNKVCIFQCEQI